MSHAVLVAVLALAAQSDPAKDVKSKDPLVRIAAIEALEAEAGEGAEKLVSSRLEDRDWGVRQRAIDALATLGTKESVRPLVVQALEAPTARMRASAAAALGRIDGVAAAEGLAKKMRGNPALPVVEALARVGPAVGGHVDARKLQRWLEADDARIREATARVLLLAAETRDETLAELVVHRDLVVAAAALETVIAHPTPADVGPLVDLLLQEDLPDVLERRAERAVCAALASFEDETLRADFGTSAVLGRLTGGPARARGARIVARLAAADPPIATEDELADWLDDALASDSVDARAAAAKALRSLGGERALAAALAGAEADRSPRVRYQHVVTVLELRGLDEPPHVDWLVARLGGDPHNSVRELAVVALGRRGFDRALPALVTALEDGDRWIAVCAAVSLGKTGAEATVAPLARLCDDDDWRLRGAAVVGLMHTSRAEAVEPLVGRLEDEEPLVARSAHEALVRLLGRSDATLGDDGLPSEKEWRAWLDELAGAVRVVDREALEARRAKYGYSTPDAEVYDGLDIVVLESRGDHIEEILDSLGIGHRKTASAQVTAAALHPGALFFANCTGEVEAADVERIAWFVRTGGSFFGSCWALSQTIERIYPGVMRKLATPGEVLDDVRADACAPTSEFLNGVFPPGVRPIYHLEGAHLIEVLDPERAEVLIDSPDAAARHGGGNLAAWFRAGHGVILDSVNHFDLQGLEVAQGLKKPVDRQAYAIDHMGLTYDRLREVEKDKFWKNAYKASQAVPDLSAFRFVTNFVRAKRVADG